MLTRELRKEPCQRSQPREETVRFVRSIVAQDPKMWIKLQKRYVGGTSINKYTVLLNLINTMHEAEMDISYHIVNLESHCTRLETVASTLEGVFKVTILMSSLQDRE